MLADGGKLTRAVRYLGESGPFPQSGDPTDAGRSLPLDGPDVIISENDVFAIAGAWSLDSTTLHDHLADPDQAYGAGSPELNANARAAL